MKSKNVAHVVGKLARVEVPKLEINWPLPDQLMGIEIEIDTVPGTIMPQVNHPSWQTKRDGSLRNGNEYVLTQPLSGNLLSKAISAFFSGKYNIVPTTTGSTHIHVDMLEESTSVEAIQVMVLLFYMLESAIFRMYAPDREWCGYTNKLSTAPEHLLGNILTVQISQHLELALGGNLGRYYGLNLQALFKFGSVELRYFPTATSKEELIEWLTLAQMFKKAALDLGNIAGVEKVVSDSEHYSDFINTYFGQWYDAIISEVPYDHALMMFNKAMAVASAYQWSATNAQNIPDMYNFFRRTKKYSKLVKKQNKDSQNTLLNVIHLNDNDRVPPAESVDPYTILLYGNSVYFAARNWLMVNDRGWFGRERQNLEIGRRILHTLQYIRSSGNHPTCSGGVLDSYIEQLASNLTRITEAQARTVIPPYARPSTTDIYETMRQASERYIVPEPDSEGDSL